MVSKSFFESLEEIAYERGLDIVDVLGRVEVAMSIACKNSDVPYKGTIKMEYDLEKKKVRFFSYYYVVDEIDPEGPRGQILLEEALVIKPKIKVGQEYRDEVKLDLFKRKAASLFKQNLLNELKTLEREEAFSFFNDKVGEVVSARVTAANDRFITFDLGKGIDVTMSLSDGLPNETYEIGKNLKVYIVRVEKTGKGPKIYICRNNKEIVKKLFELNIPEISSGQIEIMGISRDPGYRTKIGVLSVNGGIDAKGACVGAGGSRIRLINDALSGEKIDIFVWKSNPVELIAEALSPSKVLSVMPDEKTKKALVIVNDDQFSLAIGKNGQNARLAAFATGWKIDIKKLTDAAAEGLEFTYNVNN